MNAKDVLQKYLDVDNTPMKGNEWIIDCMTEYAQSLLPQWRPIDEIESVEVGELIVYKDRELEAIYSTAHIFDKHHSIQAIKKLYTHFLILPKP